MLEHTRRTWIDSVDVLIKLAEITDIVTVMRLDNSHKYTKISVHTVGTHKNPFLIMDFQDLIGKKGVRVGDICTFKCWLNAKGLTLFVVADDIFCHRNKKLSFRKWLNYTLDLQDLQDTIGRVIQKGQKIGEETPFTEVDERQMDINDIYKEKN